MLNSLTSLHHQNHRSEAHSLFLSATKMEAADNTHKPNGVSVDEENEESYSYTGTQSQKPTSYIKIEQDVTLYTIFNRLISEIFFHDSSTTMLQRMKGSFCANIPLLREACQNTGRDVLLWTRRGTPLRALIVVSVGTIGLLCLTGVLVFMLFFLVATFNAVVISLLLSLAAAGGFLALFFTCGAAIYVGALSVAVVVISTATILAIIATLIATGWIGFFWIMWLAAQKSIGLAKHSVAMTGSALSTYSSAWKAHHHHE